MPRRKTDPLTEKAFFFQHDPAVLRVLRSACVGIAGAGGLGSTAAVALARAGVGRLLIADFDRVSASNLNRQQFFRDQIGMTKIHALLENLSRINPYSEYVGTEVRVTPRNTARLFGEADVMIEAFDKAAEKQRLIETWLRLFPERPIIAASGLAGIGGNAKIRQRRVGSLYICGDEETDLRKGVSPLAPRVGIVACMQANLAIELLVRAAGL